MLRTPIVPLGSGASRPIEADTMQLTAITAGLMVLAIPLAMSPAMGPVDTSMSLVEASSIAPAFKFPAVSSLTEELPSTLLVADDEVPLATPKEDSAGHPTPAIVQTAKSGDAATCNDKCRASEEPQEEAVSLLAVFVAGALAKFVTNVLSSSQLVWAAGM